MQTTLQNLSHIRSWMPCRVGAGWPDRHRRCPLRGCRNESFDPDQWSSRHTSPSSLGLWGKSCLSVTQCANTLTKEPETKSCIYWNISRVVVYVFSWAFWSNALGMLNENGKLWYSFINCRRKVLMLTVSGACVIYSHNVQMAVFASWSMANSSWHERTLDISNWNKVLRTSLASLFFSDLFEINVLSCMHIDPK